MNSRRIHPKLLVAGMLAASLLMGCQPAPVTKETTTNLFFPAPPASPRIQFLTWASSSDEVEEARSAMDAYVLGEEAPGARRITKPYGIAARDGVVYVCDTKGLNLTKLDFRNKEFSVMGEQGPGRLRKPLNIVIDPLGYKFVVDSYRQAIVVFDPQDKYYTMFDIPKPCHPVDVAVYKNELYVLDNDESCQVVVLDRFTGEVLRTIGEEGEEEGQFFKANSISMGPEGYLYVSDTHNFRFQKLTTEGEVVWVKGAAGYGIGQFGRPRGIRVAPDGVVYVVDGATEVVQMFNADGETLMHFGGPGNVPGSFVLPSTVAIDATSIPYFQEYIHDDFDVEYLVFVINQYGPYLVNVFAFGSFPEGYELPESQRNVLPPLDFKDDIMGAIEIPEGATDVQDVTPNIPRHDTAGESEESGSLEAETDDSNLAR